MSFTALGALRELDVSRHRAELYRAWNTGLSAGLSPALVLEEMGAIGNSVVDETRRYLVIGMGQRKSVTALVKARPNFFEPFEGAVLAAGDETGKMNDALRLLTDHFGREYKLRLKVRNSLGYPVFVFLTACFGLPFVMLPKSPVKTYVTAILMLLGAFFLVGGVFLSVISTIMLNTSATTRARFAMVLAMALEAGIPLGRAVRLAVDASGNPRLKELIKNKSEQQLSSTPLAKLFEGSTEIPAGLIGQMMVADATADYKGTIGRYAAELEARN